MPDFKTIASYDPEAREILVIAPTPELHELARGVPGAVEQKKAGRWRIPATPAVVASLCLSYRGRGLLMDRECARYARDTVHAADLSARALSRKVQPPIPITAVQPTREWLHQRKAFWFAYPLEAAMLAVTMGGGKTKTAIDLILNWKARDVLIISPQKAIEDAWEPQLEKYMVGRFDAAICATGPIRKRTVAADDTMHMDYPHRIVVINHEAFWREPFASWALARQWDLIIADESHREKSAGSKSSRFLGRLAMRARRRLCLTGTPMPHSPLDVYGQYRFLDRGIFGLNSASFKNEYAEFGGWEGRVIIGFKNLDRLYDKFATIAIQIDDSAQGLPEVAPDLMHTVVLEPAARETYDELDREFITQYERGEITAANAGVKLLRLHQIACGHVTIEEDGKRRAVHISDAKLDGLRDVLEDLPVREPVVIFARFTADIAAIYDACGRTGRRVSELSGQRNELQEWKAGKSDVLVAQIQAAKEGIDLTRSSIGIFYSTGISLGDYLQCRKRIHRPPQRRMVRFIHLLARATRDVSTMRSLSRREDVIKATLSGGR